MLAANPLRISDYMNVSSTVVYHFGLHNNVLYFKNSEIVFEN